MPPCSFEMKMLYLVTRIHSLPFCFSLYGQGSHRHHPTRTQGATTKSATSVPRRDVTITSATSIPHRETWPASQQHLYHRERREHQVSSIYNAHSDVTTRSATSKSTLRDITTKSTTSVPYRETWLPSQQHLYHTQRRDDQVSSIYTTQSDVTTKSAISNSTQRYGATKSATSIPHREAWPPSQQHLYHIERRDSKVSNIYTNHIDHRVSNIYTTQRDVTTKSATSIPHREAWTPSQQHLYHIERRDHQVSNIYTTQRDVTTKSATSIPHREAWQQSQQHLYQPHRPPSQQHLYHTERRDHKVSNIYTT